MSWTNEANSESEIVYNKERSVVLLVQTVETEIEMI